MTIRSHRPLFIRWAMPVLLVAVGYAVAYWQFAWHTGNIQNILKQITLENQQLQTRINDVERKLEIEKASQILLNSKLGALNSENMKMKTELLFYKNMAAKSPRR